MPIFCLVSECFPHAVLPAASPETLPLQQYLRQRWAHSCGGCTQCKSRTTQNVICKWCHLMCMFVVISVSALKMILPHLGHQSNALMRFTHSVTLFHRDLSFWMVVVSQLPAPSWVCLQQRMLRAMQMSHYILRTRTSPFRYQQDWLS